MRTFLLGVALAVALVVGFGAGFAFDHYYVWRGVSPDEPSDARGVFGTFWQAWRIVQTNYVDPSAAQPTKLEQGAISGMVDALGDTGHSRYLTAQDVKEEQQTLAGKLEGIGIQVEMRDGLLTIVTPLDGSPAQKAGIKAGDVIQRVNGQDITHLTLDQASALIRGPRGTSVHLSILRQGVSALLEFTIVRAEITVPDVTWVTMPGTKVADLRLSQFGENADGELRDAIAAARKEGDDKLILDLRNDPGGLLDQAVSITSEFVDTGDVVLEEDRSGKKTPLAVKPGGVALHEPLVVLVNEGTASAAEIVSGAIQDHRRAKIVGEQTFGTGTVLNEFMLNDGSAVLLGTLQWLTPDGRQIWNNGIKPDVVVAFPATGEQITPDLIRSGSIDPATDPQLEAAVKMLGSP